MDIPRPEDRELAPLPESDLSKWAKRLGFEADEEMDILASEIVKTNPDDEYRIKQLLAEYNFRAYWITVDKNKRSAEDSLALILQSTHFHFIKGMFLAVLGELKEINLALKSPEIDDETYELIGDVIIATRKEVGQEIIVFQPSLKPRLSEVLSPAEIEKLYLLAETKSSD